jgi:hypothetical protein
MSRYKQCFEGTPNQRRDHLLLTMMFVWNHQLQWSRSSGAFVPLLLVFLGIPFWIELLGVVGPSSLFAGQFLLVDAWIPHDPSFAITRHHPHCVTNRPADRIVNSWTHNPKCFVMMHSTVSGDEDKTGESGSDTSNNSESSKMYQRVLYRFSPGSEVDIHDSIVVEERCRFIPDPDRSDYVLPVGARTIILRDGRVDDGEIGDEIFRMDIESLSSGGGKTHNGAGNDPSIISTIATILFLASNPDLCRGRMLQLAAGSDQGLSTVLGAIGAAFVQGGKGGTNPHHKDVAEDILTIANTSDGMFPKSLEMLALSDSDEEILEMVFHKVRKIPDVPSSKIAMDRFDWRVRLPRSIQHPSLYKEYRTVVVPADVSYTYPEAKELARSVANRLEPSERFLLSGAPVPRLVHVTPEDRDDVPYLRRLLEKGYRMSVDMRYLKLEKLSFLFQKTNDQDPEEILDDLALELKEFKELKYQSLVAQHHPEYAGEGSGELFFPMDTGEYEVTGGSTFLERDPGMSPW